MRHLRWLRRVGVLAAVAALAACGGTSSTSAGMTSAGSTSAGAASAGSSSSGAAAGGPAKKVAVGVIPIIDVAPLYLGVQKGIFTKHGLDVTPKPAQGGAAIVPAVLAGEDQFGFSNVVSLLTAREKGVPLLAIAAGSSSTGDATNDVNAVLVGKGSTLQSAKDLAGKKVAINSLNNIGDTTIKAAVEKAGGDPKSVKFVELPFPDMPAQLAAGKVDAVWESEPFRSAILGAGGRVLFDNLTETYPKLQIATYFTSEAVKAKDPQLVDNFVAAVNESMEYATAHPDEARAVLATYTKITGDVANKVVLPAWPTELDQQSATAIGQAAQKYGTLKKDPDVKGLYAVKG
ncbi:MAG TPA: ABC transporter substrate-binding protein [Kineosporiaceae bacterium]